MGRLLPAVVLLVCLSAWLPAGLGVWPSVLVGVVRASRRPRGGGSLLRWGAGMCADVVLSSVAPFVRPVRRRTLRRAVTVCAVLCLSVADRGR
ncbi:hypothetical protein DF19_17670 [Streptomyces olindensis]|nr:hypothetical protein DF19_17670 [Streptomyces olindensis]